MNTKTTLQVAALALTLGLSVAAQAGDFDDNYPLFTEAQAGQQASPAAPQRVVIVAPAAKQNPRYTVSTEASRAMVGEDSGSFWMAQQISRPADTALALADGR